MNLNTLIAILLLTGLVMGGLYAVISTGASQNNYNVVVPNNDFQQFDATNNLTNSISQRYSDIQNLSSDKTTVGFVSFIPDVIVIFRDLLSLPFTVAYAILAAMVNVLNLPIWAGVFLFGFLGLIVVMAFIKAVLGREV